MQCSKALRSGSGCLRGVHIAKRHCDNASRHAVQVQLCQACGVRCPFSRTGCSYSTFGLRFASFAKRSLPAHCTTKRLYVQLACFLSLRC